MNAIIRSFDRHLAAVVALIPDFFRPALIGATVVGYPAAMAGLAAVCALIALEIGMTNVVAACLLAIVSLAVPTGIKLLTRRTRPDTLYVQNMRFKSYSFPSGHSFASLVVLGVFIIVGASPFFATPILIAAILMVGVSRVYLGAHFPSDVLGGWLLGLAALVLILRVTHV